MKEIEEIFFVLNRVDREASREMEKKFPPSDDWYKGVEFALEKVRLYYEVKEAGVTLREIDIDSL